ncbi:hypothetical protein [Planctellipticum variicoloris]|uniref:hypothetical protein n=1 Tax=Planctellipticum variicoloris TaxID=3064265 RepID=UPI0030139BCB|nr:hypothetical protein SH412_005300 [Planctomycetaceae bacterium SH412]
MNVVFPISADLENSGAALTRAAEIGPADGSTSCACRLLNVTEPRLPFKWPTSLVLAETTSEENFVRTYWPRISAIALTLVTLFTVGCGGGSTQKRLPVYPVKGTLTLDSKPLGNVELQLQSLSSQPDSLKPPAYGTVGADGTFVLSTYGKGDGAPEGDYEVALTADAMNPVGLPSFAPFQVSIKKDTGIIAIDLKSTKTRRQGAGMPLVE